MSENSNGDSKYRAEPLSIAKRYIDNNSQDKGKLLSDIKSLDYKGLFDIQRNRSLWEQLLLDPNPLLRRQLCAKAYKITQNQISSNISGSTKTGFSLLNFTVSPVLSNTFILAIMFNVPWQIIVEKEPDLYSFREYTEYYLKESAKVISIDSLCEEKDRIGRNITGYVMTDSRRLIEQAGPSTTGRWVTTYPEMDYFEFHLKSEPVLYNAKIKEIAKFFPFATHLVTTYTPFRKERSLWILGPKPGKDQDFQVMLRKLESRDLTVIHKI